MNADWYWRRAERNGHPDKAARMREQWKEAFTQTTVHCGCGRLRALTMAFRCIYCGEWYCLPCAEAHFGEGVLEHDRKQVANAALEAAPRRTP